MTIYMDLYQEEYEDLEDLYQDFEEEFILWWRYPIILNEPTKDVSHDT